MTNEPQDAEFKRLDAETIYAKNIFLVGGGGFEITMQAAHSGVAIWVNGPGGRMVSLQGGWNYRGVGLMLHSNKVQGYHDFCITVDDTGPTIQLGNKDGEPLTIGIDEMVSLVKKLRQ